MGGERGGLSAIMPICRGAVLNRKQARCTAWLSASFETRSLRHTGPDRPRGFADRSGIGRAKEGAEDVGAIQAAR